MAELLALEAVYQDVKATLAVDAPGVQVVFGRREATKQINQGTGRGARVVFIPDVDGEVGDYSGARAPGRNPRPLRTLNHTAEVRVWAYDGAAPNDELAQYRGVHRLHDAVVRAIELSLRSEKHANLPATPYEKLRKVGDLTERRFGEEWAFTVILDAMVPDQGYDEASDVVATIQNWLDDTADGSDAITGDPP